MIPRYEAISFIEHHQVELHLLPELPARILDIGRTSWLLEAVRDAQDNNKELPPDLVKELSRNLFAYSTTDVSDLHPQAVSDILLQGLNSLRVKTADGSEIEAKRGKG